MNHVRVAKSLLVVSVVGFFITFPLWLTNRISDRAMLGLTLVLSWAALWFSAYIAILEAKKHR
jgi:flagellar biosynthesis protein FliR